jgi:hypothetical protein
MSERYVIGDLHDPQPEDLLRPFETEAKAVDAPADEPEPIATQDELRAILSLLDGLAGQWGDEAVFRRARDRLRKVIGEETSRKIAE